MVGGVTLITRPQFVFGPFNGPINVTNVTMIPDTDVFNQGNRLIIYVDKAFIKVYTSKNAKKSFSINHDEAFNKNNPRSLHVQKSVITIWKGLIYYRVTHLSWICDCSLCPFALSFYKSSYSPMQACASICSYVLVRCRGSHSIHSL